MSTTIEGWARDLAERRRYANAVYEDYRQTYEAFLAEHADLTALKDAAQEALTLAETALRQAAVIAYKETGEKKLAPGVEVKVGKALVYDPAAALKWAMEHRVCLTLDRKVFEKVAEASCPEMVTVVEKPVANIATDLGAFYPATVALEKAAVTD